MTLADGIQVASTALAAIAAGAAWVAAKATRDSAHQTRQGTLVAVRAARLENLRKIHTDVSWLREDKRDWRQRGLEIRGRIVATGYQLPHCNKLCDLLDEMKLDLVVSKAAEGELRAAMENETRLLAQLENKPGYS
jgi:hypothetical protein